MIIPYQHTIKNTQQVLILVIVWYLTILTMLNAQPIPNEFFQFKSQKLLYDAGENWKTLTLFGPVRFQHINASQKLGADSLYIKTRAGVYYRNHGLAVYGFGHFTYEKYFYGYLYPRIINNPNAFMRYSGVPRDISRGGFSSGETDLSGIGFQNSWVTLQVGRGRESWSAGNDIQLVLSEDSPAYDYAILGSDYGNLRVKYIHGYLESTKEGINRYITARGLEWTNKRSLIIGISETVIYSGFNRSLDIGYLNPISTHLEIELNNRLNMQGSGDANAVWQISADWLIKDKLRFSGNYLYDEFVIDGVQLAEGKEHGKAYSLRSAYTPIHSKTNILTAFASFVYVGTPTFRHGVGTNNFVQRGFPLGWRHGSDAQQLTLGLNFYNNRSNIIASITTGMVQSGEESIVARVYDPYADYLKGAFPSGNVTESLFLNSNIQWCWKPNISIITGIEWTNIISDKNQITLNLGVDIYWPARLIL